MFESLTERLQETFRKLSGQGRISEDNITDAVREVKRALLEADVNLQVVKDFVSKVKEKAVGQEVLKSISPDQQFIKIVYDEMISLMGAGDINHLNVSEKSPTIYMIVGLQGSGKTTTCAKLALYLKKQGKRPLLVAGDIYRPAAIKQLEVLGSQINIPVFNLGQINPVEIIEKATKHAKDNGFDYIILDTAGRLHIDTELMGELVKIKEFSTPSEILLVVDAMIGQDAVKMSETFNQYLDISGVIVTKLDGDTRGGAALSVKSVTGKPVKLMASGEKIEALDVFHPERIASRILGMGDVLTLIEKAKDSIDESEARALEKKLRKSEFTLEDFLSQMKQIKKLGSLEQLISMLPGIGGQIKSDDIAEGEKQMKVIEAIISSMTPLERRDPSIMNISRKIRVAKGSGTKVDQVNKLLKQFGEMRKMIKSLSSAGMFDMGKGKKGKKLKKMMERSMGGGMDLGGGMGGFPPNMNPDKLLGKNLTNFPFKK